MTKAITGYNQNAFPAFPMPKLGPIKHKELIRYMRQLGFSGPYGRGAKHDIMQKGNLTVTVPTKHGSGVINDVGLLKRILKQAGIDVKEWENL